MTNEKLQIRPEKSLKNLSGNWQYWSNHHKRPTAGLLSFPKIWTIIAWVPSRKRGGRRRRRRRKEEEEGGGGGRRRREDGLIISIVKIRQT
jgi:hypothetical protein